MQNLNKRFEGVNSTIVLLVAAAIGALLFTTGAGLLVYDNTQALIASAAAVQHTQEVLAALERASLLAERADFSARIYLLSGDAKQLGRVRSSAGELELEVSRISELIADNPAQVISARDLAGCAVNLSQAGDNLTRQSPGLSEQARQCGQIVTVMEGREQLLLKRRDSSTRHNRLASIAAEVVFVGLSLVTLVVLFGFLLRDACKRRQVAAEVGQANENLARTVKALEVKVRESDLMTLARDELQLCVDVHQVHRCAASSFSRLLAGTSGSLCMINNSRQLVEVVSSWEGRSGKSAIEDFQPVEACCGLRSGQPRWRRPGLSELECAHFSNSLPPDRYLCKPIVAHGNAVGMLYVQCVDDQQIAMVNDHMDGVRQLVQLVGMAIASLNLRARLENQSIRDPLTDLFNRYFMQISLERELARAARRNQTLAVFMIDVDRFKTFNDTYGHAAGDSVLRAIAEVFSMNTRTEDIACRYGGEEFTLILPDIAESAAFERAEDIRRSVSTLRVPVGKDNFGDLSVSIGVALYPDDADSSDLLLRRADQALYRAKHLGRNRIVMFEEAASLA
jgi:diguanylate cyclase (GGDEF)-like protein